MNILPKRGERAFVIGKTKSGKTYLTLQMIKTFYGKDQIQILETKGDKSILSLNAPIVEELRQVSDYPFPEYPAVIYAPRGKELADKKYLDAWCEWIYMRGDTVAWIDELTQIVSSTHASPGFLDLYTRGRTHNCTVFAGNQRPRGVPPIVYTEAENYYKFRLNDVKDRKRVAEFTHPEMAQQTADLHGFHYFNEERSDDVYYVASI